MARRRRPPRSGAIAELPPLRILGQIAALQGIYYAAALVLMLFATLVAGSRFSLDLVFGWASLRGDTTHGWLLAFVWLCCAGVLYVFFLLSSQPSLTLIRSSTLIEANEKESHPQCRRAGRAGRALEARPRLRPHPARAAPGDRDAVHGVRAAARHVVGHDGRLERRRRRRRHLRLPVARAAAHQLRRQQ